MEICIDGTMENNIDSDIKIDFNKNLNLNDDASPKDTKKKTSGEKFFLIIHKNAFVFPLILAFGLPILCTVPYIAAVNADQANPIFPYISDVGALPPQAGFFAFMMDFLAVLFLVIGYYRYKMVEFYIKHQVTPSSASQSNSFKSNDHYNNMNFLALLLVIVSSFAGMAVGDFRVSELMPCHLTAVFFEFMPLITYVFIHLYIGYWLYQHRIESRPFTIGVICIIFLVCMIGITFLAPISIYLAGNENAQNVNFRLKWSDYNQRGYYYHCAATTLEWILVNSLAFFSLCFSNRMRKFKHFDKI